MTDDATSARLQAGYAYLPGDAPAYWNFGTYTGGCSPPATAPAGGRPPSTSCSPRASSRPRTCTNDAEEAFFVLEGDLTFTLGDDDTEITAPPGTYIYIPPGTRHSFRCGSTVGRVYNTLVPGGFDHGIPAHGTPAPQVQMPPPGTSALEVWKQLAPGRPTPQWERDSHDVSSW